MIGPPIAALALAVAIVLTVGTTATAAPSPKEQLRDAAKGTWSGPFGTLEFGSDDTVAFSVIDCGYTPLQPGFVQTYTDCAPDVLTGTLRVRRDGYGIEATDGALSRFAAYVADDGLHLGYGVVARLSSKREGTAELGPNERLRIRDGTCRYSSTFSDPIEARCRFVKRDDRTILLYTGPDPFAGGTVGTAALVYLPGQRLLVSTDLVDRIYARADA